MAAKPKALPRLTVDAIKAADDRKSVPVDVPEWGGSLLIKGVSKAEWEHFQALDSPDDVNYLLAKAIVEPEMTEDDIAALREKSVVAVGRVENAVLEACGLGSAIKDAEARFLAGNAGE